MSLDRSNPVTFFPQDVLKVCRAVATAISISFADADEHGISAGKHQLRHVKLERTCHYGTYRFLCCRVGYADPDGHEIVFVKIIVH